MAIHFTWLRNLHKQVSMSLSIASNSIIDAPPQGQQTQPTQPQPQPPQHSPHGVRQARIVGVPNVMLGTIAIPNDGQPPNMNQVLQEPC